MFIDCCEECWEWAEEYVQGEDTCLVCLHNLCYSCWELHMEEGCE